MRVTFNSYDYKTAQPIYVAAVYCHDLYAEEIKAEREAGNVNGFFSHNFYYDDNDFHICPDTSNLNI